MDIIIGVNLQILNLTLEGNPISQKRHRYCNRGKFIQLYNPSEKDQKDIKIQIEKQLLNKTVKDTLIFAQGCALDIQIVFYMPIQKSVSKSKRSALNLNPHICKPDLDNLAKFYLDCMSGLVFHDDNQVSSLMLHKVYSENPKTTIQVLCVK